MKNETGRSTDSTRTQEKQMKEFDKKDVVVNDVDGNAVDALSADLADMVATQTDSVEEVQLSLSKKEKELEDSKQDAKEGVDVAAADSDLAGMIMAESQNAVSSAQGGGAASADGGLSTNGKLLAAAGVVTAAGIAVAASDGGGSGGGGKNNQEFTVSIDSPSATEGDSGTKVLNFTVTLDEEPTSAVTFNYSVTGGTATGDVDFDLDAGTITFEAGQTVKTVSVTVRGDTIFEADETVILTVSGDKVEGGTNSVSNTGTITNDDANPSTFIYDLSVNSPTVVEGDSGTTVLRYELSLDRIPTEAVQVGFQTLTSGTATAGTDFVAQSGSVSFAAGQRTAIVDIVVNGDTVLESDETVSVRFTGTTLSAAVTATGEITNDDLDPSVDSYTLKSGTDVATANVFNSGLVFTPAGNDQVNSLDNEDELTGVGVNPTLNLTLGNNNDNGLRVITPTLNNIQTVNVRFDDQVGMALDLQDSPDVEVLNITRVNLGGATVGNMQSVVDDISVANSNALAAITLTYINSVLSGTNDVVDVELSNVQSNLFTIGSNVGAPLGGFAAATPTQQLERVNFTISSDSFLQALNLLPDGVATTGQILDLLANATFVIGNDTDGDGDILEHNAGLLGIGGLNVINVAGAGDVTLGNVGSMAGFTLAGASHTGDLMVNISNAAGDGTASFTSGSGDDTILSNASLLGDVVTNAGTDNVTINGNLVINGPAGLFSSIDTGAGDDNIAVTGNVAGSVFGGASILSGDGDDTVLIGTIPTSPSPANLIVDAATLTALRGLGNVGEEAVINTGAGNDNLTLTGTTAGDTGGAADGDNLASQILLGDGDDNITFNLTNQGAVGTLIGGTIDGGTGNNVLSVIGNTNANVVVSDATDADRVTGIQTLNLTSSQSIDEELFQAIEAVRQGASPAVNDGDDDAFNPTPATATTPAIGSTTNEGGGELDNAQSADYVVDISEFTGLSTINLKNEAGVINATPEEATNIRIFQGDAVTNTLMNLQGGEAINVATVEAGTGIAGENRTTGGIDGRISGSTELATDTAADMTLNLSLALAATDQSVDVLIDEVGIAGQLDGDVAINDVGVWTAMPAVADTHKEITDLNLTVNGSTDRTIALGAGDFRNMLSLSSNAVAGTTLSLTGVEATTIAAGSVLADLNITVLTSEGKTITTGSGDDVVNLLADVVDGSTTLAAANRDVIDLGAGTNRIIVGNSLRGAGADADEVFDNLKNIQEVELRGNTNATLDDDAFLTGVTDVILGQAATVIGTQGTVTDLDIGVDFDRALNVSMMSGTSLDVDNDSNQNLTVNMGTTGSMADNILTLTDAGTGNVVLNVTVDNVAQSIGAAGTGANNDVIITNLDNTGEIDRIVLLDSMQQSTIAGAAATAAGQISLTLNAAWAQASDTLTVDASDIDDDDLDANGDGDRTDAGSDNVLAPRGDIGFSTGTGPEVGNDINDTQTVRIDASGANYKVNITGSQVVDTIIGSNLADVIDGQAGNDIITGGLGSDSLTGGAGSDTFVYNNVAESDGNTASTDTINDFVTGTDKVQLTITDNANTTFNFGSFASVASSGDGDNSLQGTNTVRVVGDGFYDAGADKLIIDVDGDGDITTTNDYQINSAGEIVAADVNFVLNAAGNANNLVVRGGQGADNITTGAGDDVFVMVGNLTNADVDGYVAAGNAAAVGIDANIARVLSYSELTATNGTATEARGGEVINGGAGNDNLHVFGTVNLTAPGVLADVVLTSIEVVTAHSSLTMSQSQVFSVGQIVLSGDTEHNITIVADDGSTLTYAQQLAVFASMPQPFLVTGSGVNTSVTLGGNSLIDAGDLAAGGVNDAAASNTVNDEIGTVGGAAQPNAPTAPDLDASDDTGVSNQDNITSQPGSLTFNGNASVGASVTVFDDIDNDGVFDADEASATVIADQLGNYNVDLDLADGDHYITSFVTDANGIRSDLSGALYVQVDSTLAPPAPVIDLNTASDSGVDTADDLTSDTTPTFDITAEVDSTVEVFVDGVAAGMATETGPGTYTFTSLALADGPSVITAKATDVAGNTGPAGSLTVTIDATAPIAPVVDLDAASDSAGDSDNYTSDGTPSFTISAEAGSSVEVFQNGASVGLASESTPGVFTFTVSPILGDGTYAFTAQATDAAGNVGLLSADLDVTVDTVVAAPIIDLDVASDTGDSNIDNITSDNTPSITITAEANSTVEVLLDGLSVGFATETAPGSGSYTFTSGVIADGPRQFVATVTDQAGNTVTGGAFNFTIDTTQPTVSINTPVEVDGVVNAAEAPDVVVSGTAVGAEGQSITVSFDDGVNPVVSVMTTVNAGAGWTIAPTDISGLNDGNVTVTATVNDVAGNTGTATTPIGKDTVAPVSNVTTASYNNQTGVLVLTGTGFMGNTVDVASVGWDFDSDSPASVFALTAASAAVVDSDTQITITLDAAEKAALEADPAFAGAAEDQIVIGAGFLADAAGNESAAQVAAAPIALNLLGTAGADTLDGGSQNDVLNGGGDMDTLNGNGGDDVIVGGDGDDTLTGGTGVDIFGGLIGSDTINLEDGVKDEVHFRSVDGTDTVGGTGTFSFDGEDVIFFLDNGVTDNFTGSVDFTGFADTTAGSAGTAFDAGQVGVNYFEFADAAGFSASAGGSAKLAVVNADLVDGTAILGNYLNSYVLVDTGAQLDLYFDTDWTDVGSRELVASFTGVADTTNVGFEDFGVYTTV